MNKLLCFYLQNISMNKICSVYLPILLSMPMIHLNLPQYQFKYRMEDNQRQIFDVIRKKYVSLTPEEWVRQNFLQYLICEKHYPPALISVEHEFRLNRLSKRCDAVVFSTSGIPRLIIELKSPDVSINQQVFDQIYRYNLKIRASYLMVSNGLKHYCCKVDYESNSCVFLDTIPDYSVIRE